MALATANAHQLRYFSESNADLNARHPETGRTALHTAALAGNEGLVRVLLEIGGDRLDVNLRDGNGRTALELAAFDCVARDDLKGGSAEDSDEGEGRGEGEENEEENEDPNNAGGVAAAVGGISSSAAAVAGVQCLLVDWGAKLGRRAAEVDALVWRNANAPGRAAALAALARTKHGGESIAGRGSPFFGCPALWAAALRGRVGALRALLRAGADPDAAYEADGGAPGRYRPGALKKGVVMGGGECSKLALKDGEWLAFF